MVKKTNSARVSVSIVRAAAVVEFVRVQSPDRMSGGPGGALPHMVAGRGAVGDDVDVYTRASLVAAVHTLVERAWTVATVTHLHSADGDEPISAESLRAGLVYETLGRGGAGPILGGVVGEMLAARYGSLPDGFGADVPPDTDPEELAAVRASLRRNLVLATWAEMRGEGTLLMAQLHSIILSGVPHEAFYTGAETLAAFNAQEYRGSGMSVTVPATVGARVESGAEGGEAEGDDSVYRPSHDTTPSTTPGTSGGGSPETVGVWTAGAADDDDDDDDDDEEDEDDEEDDDDSAYENFTDDDAECTCSLCANVRDAVERWPAWEPATRLEIVSKLAVDSIGVGTIPAAGADPL
jgi:hypothetical protein